MEADFHGLTAGGREDCRTFVDLRNKMRNNMRARFTSADLAASLVLGGFNFVMDPTDRRAMGAMLESGAVNTGEADHWARRLGRPCRLAEMAQEAMTHRTDSSQGRLDRIYGNFHTVDQLDKDLRVIALPWRLRLSSHRPVSFRRSTVEKKLVLGVSAAALQHTDFHRRVRLAFADSLMDHLDADAIIRLRLFKDAMVSVSRNLARKTQGVSAVTTLGENWGLL